MISLVFLYLVKVLFSGFFQFEDIILYLATQNALTELLSQIMSNFTLKIKDCV